MAAQKGDYKPINCGFHDRLEAWSITRAECEVEYYAESGDIERARSTIDDVYSAEGGEFVRLASGEVIRLDRLKSVNGVQLPGASALSA